MFLGMHRAAHHHLRQSGQFGHGSLIDFQFTQRRRQVVIRRQGQTTHRHAMGWPEQHHPPNVVPRRSQSGIGQRRCCLVGVKSTRHSGLTDSVHENLLIEGL